MRIVLAFLIVSPGSSEAQATSEKAASYFHVRQMADIPADETADRTSLQPVSSAEHSALISWSLTLEQPSGQIRMRQCVRTLRRDCPYERLNITGIQGLSEAQKASLRALGAFEGTSRDE
jgi:hypothetical protein